MRRRTKILTILILATAVFGTFGGIGVLLKQEPDYYAAASADDLDPDTGPDAGNVLTRFGDLTYDIRLKPEWGASFRADELNALLRDFLSDGDSLAGVLPEGLHAPRVAIDGDRIKLAARYGEGFWSTVVSVELRVWLIDPVKQPKSESGNTVAVEICGVWAGSLPVGSQSQLDRISESVRDRNVDVKWYRLDGHPVGLFRFFNDQAQPTTQIRSVTVADGKVTVAGRSYVDGLAPPPRARP